MQPFKWNYFSFKNFSMFFVFFQFYGRWVQTLPLPWSSEQPLKTSGLPRSQVGKCLSKQRRGRCRNYRDMCFEDPSMSPSSGPFPVWFVLVSGYLPPPHIQVRQLLSSNRMPLTDFRYRSLQKLPPWAFYSSSVEENAANTLAFRIRSVLKHHNSKDLYIIIPQKALSCLFQDPISDISLTYLLFS